MSSMQQGSSGPSRRHSRAGANRHTWSAREEEVLIAAIRDLIAHGYKSDNGFRAGYLGRLEDAMRKEFPTSDLKGNPHINSKISSWKKTFYSLSGILSRSGVGFNTNGSFMIDVENDTWENIIRADPSARLMRYKQWPYYEVWQEIFGRDRATGDLAEDLLDVINNYNEEGNSKQAESGAAFGGEQEGEHIQTEEDSIASDSNMKRATSFGASRGKKPKMSRDVQEVCAVLDRIGRSSDERLDKLAGRFGYDFDLDKKLKEAFEKMRAMDFLTVDQRFDVCELLSKEVDKLKVFWNMLDDDLPAMSTTFSKIWTSRQWPVMLMA